MPEDWERIAFIDSIYLLEAQIEMEQQILNPEYGQIEIAYELQQVETN